MHKKNGFSLIEFLIYFFLVLLLSTLVIHWVTSSHIRMSSVGNRCLQSLAVCAAVDCLMRDLYAAPYDLREWKLCDDALGYVWHVGTLDIGLSCSDGILVRSEGVYNGTSHEWTARKKSVIAQDITSCTLTRVLSENGGQVRQIQMKMQSKVYDHEYRVQQNISIRNGAV